MIEEILRNVSIWIILIPFFIGVMNYKGLNLDSKWIFLLVSIGVVPQILTAVIPKERAALNISYNIYTPIEFAILYTLFYSKFRSASNRLFTSLSFWLYAIICLYLFILFGIKGKFLNDLVCINNILYMIWILFLFRQEYAVENSIIERENPFTWYLVALIIYAPSTLIIFALYYYVRDPSNPGLRSLWIAHSIPNVLLYLFISIGLVIRKDKS